MQLYLESPPGVGFSYCAEQLSDPSYICSASDETTAEANLDALRSFLKKFPQYEGRDFFITGEVRTKWFVHFLLHISLILFLLSQDQI